MIRSRTDKLLEKVDSPFAAVIVVAKRARQINSHRRALAKGDFGTLEGVRPPMVKTDSKNEVAIAVQELEQGKIGYTYKDE